MSRGVARLPRLLVAAALVAASCTGDDGPGPDQARLEVVEGSAVVTPAEGGTETVTDDATLYFGDTVTIESGSAVLELADGATYELRSHDGAGSTLLIESPPVLSAGDALVVDGFPAQIKVDTATLTAQGALRVDADETAAAAYAGRTRVAGAGDVEELLGLRRLVLVPGAVPEPITFDGSDPWDRRYLGEAIAFGEQLEALARGYTSDLPAGGGRTADFFRAVVPQLAAERELGDDLIDPGRSPGDTLVGAVIAAQGRLGTFRGRWEAIFAFRGAGAAWGLVALDQGVSSAPVLETVQLAVGGGPPRSTSTSTTPSSSTTSTSSTTTSSSTTSSTSTTGTSTTTTTTTVPPGGGLLDPIADRADELLGGLVDILEP